MADIRKYQMQRYRLSGSGNTIVPMAKIQVYVKESIYDWMRARFEQNRNGKKTAVIWIGACGIAVRAMAPSLRDKLTDIPVLVDDEAGTVCYPGFVRTLWRSK